MTRGRSGRWGGIALVVVFVTVFTLLNGRERISLNLGFTVLYQVALPVLVLLSFLAGMAAMFLFGLRHDMRVRRYLEEHLRSPAPPAAPPPAPDLPPPDPIP